MTKSWPRWMYVPSNEVGIPPSRSRSALGTVASPRARLKGTRSARAMARARRIEGIAWERLTPEEQTSPGVVTPPVAPGSGPREGVDQPGDVLGVLEIKVDAEVLVRRVGAGVGIPESGRGDRNAKLLDEGVVRPRAADHGD